MKFIQRTWSAVKKVILNVGIWVCALLLSAIIGEALGLSSKPEPWPTIAALLYIFIPTATVVIFTFTRQKREAKYVAMLRARITDLEAAASPETIEYLNLKESIQKQRAELEQLQSSVTAESLRLEDVRRKAQEEAENASRITLQHQRAELERLQSYIAESKENLLHLQEARDAAKAEEDRAQKSARAAIQKVEKSRELLMAIESALQLYEDLPIEQVPAVTSLLDQISAFLAPTVTLDLQCLSMKDLRKRYRQNEKHIAETLEKYRGRYTTKANIAIYNLMVIALEAELQNVLYSIKYGKLEDALANITAITKKYYEIATNGNQSIASTMKKFIGEIDFYFQEAVRIEYEYYVQKERAKGEQRAIREQMRQEAEDRRALEAEKKKVEREESKFQTQISQLEDQLKASGDSDKVAQLETRLAELKAQLSAVQEKREEITTLQNGKAGNVYVISNLGAFGDDVFKIGMTRRLEPQERVDELGSASVPFPFDVHSFIFSDDAVALENKIHKILNNRRVNKVNLRKEFFRISLDELEALVGELAPTAEFRRTMLAEQYYQSLSIDTVTESVPDEDPETDED